MFKISVTEDIRKCKAKNYFGFSRREFFSIVPTMGLSLVILFAFPSLGNLSTVIALLLGALGFIIGFSKPLGMEPEQLVMVIFKDAPITHSKLYYRNLRQVEKKDQNLIYKKNK